jgi:hypothetical protein
VVDAQTRKEPVDAASRYQTISHALCAAFPSQQDIDLLCRARYDSTIYLCLISTRPAIDIKKEGRDVIDFLAQPPSSIVGSFSLITESLNKMDEAFNISEVYLEEM